MRTTNQQKQLCQSIIVTNVVTHLECLSKKRFFTKKSTCQNQGVVLIVALKSYASGKILDSCTSVPVFVAKKPSKLPTHQIDRSRCIVRSATANWSIKPCCVCLS